jgi:hypothetical protein
VVQAIKQLLVVGRGGIDDHHFTAYLGRQWSEKALGIVQAEFGVAQGCQAQLGSKQVSPLQFLYQDPATAGWLLA